MTTKRTLGPDNEDFHYFFDDFDDYAAGDWVITTTETGTGSATEAVGDIDGGALVITNAAGDNDNDFLQWAGGAGATTETWKFETGKALQFKARFKVSDATESDVVIGLQITDTTPLAVSDGIFFQKDDGDTNLDFHVVKDSSATDVTAITTLADDTFVTVEAYYDGSGPIHLFVNDAHVGSAAVTNAPDDEELTISFGIQNGAAAAKVLTIDYIKVAKAR